MLSPLSFSEPVWESCLQVLLSCGPQCCFQYLSDVLHYVFWSWCWSPWSGQLSLTGTIIKPFCYKPNTLKIIFFVYCTCQGKAPVTFNDAGNPITANTSTPLQKGCRTINRSRWKIFEEAFAPWHTNIWIFCRKILAFWAKVRYSLEQKRDQSSE